ncbi:hypothetical protein LTR85_010028 [Meristemomyces frigidus]|nr:hypothetical protein LTR85_010028 [Meristemomyces frigidus]
MADIESMQAAANAVFDTKELLEMVLLELSMADILHLQRTCTTWHDVIKTRASLQRKLYLAANLLPQDNQVTDADSGAPVINPLFAKKHPIWSTAESSPWHLENANDNMIYTYSAMAESTFTDPRRIWLPGRGPTLKLHFVVNGAYCSRLKAVQQYGEKTRKGSWRTMLLTHDRSASIMVNLLGRDSKTCIRRVLWDMKMAPSSTMGDVFDRVEQAYMETVGSEKWRDYTASARRTPRMDVV